GDGQAGRALQHPGANGDEHAARPARRARADRGDLGSQAGQRPGAPADRGPRAVCGRRRDVRAHARDGWRRGDPGRQPRRRQRDAQDGRRARAPCRDRRLAAGCLPDPVLDLEPDVHEGGAEPARPPRGRPSSPARRGHRVRARGGPDDARAPRPAGPGPCCSRRLPVGERTHNATGPGARGVSSLRVLPLGGLGEIGKNMTVVEHDGRIVVVDVGLRFPTPEMVGIDLVLPDFSYLRERARDIEAIVVTHGHEDHLGALPWVLRELGAPSDAPAAIDALPADADSDRGARLPPVYGGALTMAMARSKLEEYKLRDVELRELATAEELELGPFLLELVHMTHS